MKVRVFPDRAARFTKLRGYIFLYVIGIESVIGWMSNSYYVLELFKMIVLHVLHFD